MGRYTEQSSLYILPHLHACVIYSPQAHVLREVYKLSGEHCNTLQTKCTERVAKNYTCDDFRSGMYVYLAYNFLH